MAKTKVVIMERLGVSDEVLDELKAPLEAMGCEFVQYERTDDVAAAADEAKDADVMIVANMPIKAPVIEQAQNLKYIDVAFTGIDHIAGDAAKSRGIVIQNAAGYSNEAVPELAVGMAIGLLRDLPGMGDDCRAGKGRNGRVGFEIKGRTVGIVGYGQIGSRSAELFHAFGASILANATHIHEDAPDYVEQVSLDELLTRSDIVVLHCPLNDSTRGLINAEKLNLMKQDALLINVARGPVVVTQDLADALNAGRISGAGIDVFDLEPPLDPANPLLHTPNTIVTPHIGFATAEAMVIRAQIVFRHLKEWLEA